jgi:hypothetical protein
MLRRLVGMAATVGMLGAAPPALAVDRHATTSTFASTFAQAQGGDTIFVAAGNYGTFTGGAKTSLVTIKPESGAVATMRVNFTSATNLKLEGLTVAGAELGGTIRNITIAGSRFTAATIIRTAQFNNSNVLLDRNKHQNINVCSGCYEGRVHLPGKGSYPSGVTIQNSLFSGGNADGIQNGSRGTRIIGNEFVDIVESAGIHTDAIQLYGSSQTLIRGNWIHRTSSNIMAPDGMDREIIEQNVIGPGPYPFLTVGSDNASIIRHNTLADGSCAWSLRCGIITIASKSGMPVSRGTIVKDNILGEVSLQNGAVPGEISGNLVVSGSLRSTDLRGLPTYMGGTSPTSYAAYTLTAGSLGSSNASDGTDRGITTGTPTPTPTPTPTGDTPAAAVWTAPTGARVNTPVTLDGTRSTGDGPLTCTWSFENQAGTTVWETATGCKLVKTFQNADTKYVRLTVRDADGDTNASVKSFSVVR